MTITTKQRHVTNAIIQIHIRSLDGSTQEGDINFVGAIRELFMKGGYSSWGPKDEKGFIVWKWAEEESQTVQGN